MPQWSPPVAMRLTPLLVFIVVVAVLVLNAAATLNPSTTAPSPSLQMSKPVCVFGGSRPPPPLSPIVPAVAVRLQHQVLAVIFAVSTAIHLFVVLLILLIVILQKAATEAGAARAAPPTSAAVTARVA